MPRDGQVGHVRHTQHVVIRAMGNGDDSEGVVVSMTQHRRYFGEVNSMAWDMVISIHKCERGGDGGVEIAPPDRYPQNMHNFASEGEIVLLSGRHDCTAAIPSPEE